MHDLPPAILFENGFHSMLIKLRTTWLIFINKQRNKKREDKQTKKQTGKQTVYQVSLQSLLLEES